MEIVESDYYWEYVLQELIARYSYNIITTVLVCILLKALSWGKGLDIVIYLGEISRWEKWGSERESQGKEKS